jgi:type IV pilus assembly protein PilC
MATFQYEAMNSVGQAIKGELDAGSSEEAIAKIRGMGNFPTKVRERAAKAKAGAPGGKSQTASRPGGGRRTVGRVARKQLTQFTRQLSTLQDAGLPILRSLRILEQQQKPGSLRVAIRLVAEDVESGATLSEAMGRHPKAFDRLYTNMVAAGEAGGVLDVILQRLAEFMERSQALRRKIVGAMIYPAVVISVAVLIVMGIMIVIIPKFVVIFKDFDAELPGPTLLLMAMSSWIVSGGWAVILLSPLAVMGIFKLMRQSKSGAYFVDDLKIKVPVMGRIVSKSSVARFSRTLGTLGRSGWPGDDRAGPEVE